MLIGHGGGGERLVVLEGVFEAFGGANRPGAIFGNVGIVVIIVIGIVFVVVIVMLIIIRMRHDHCLLFDGSGFGGLGRRNGCGIMITIGPLGMVMMMMMTMMVLIAP